MTFSADQMPAHLQALAPHQWQSLFAFIPLLEGQAQFGRVVAPSHTHPKYHKFAQMPFWESDVVAERLSKKLYDLGLVFQFDWTDWQEGNRLLSDRNFDFHTLDPLHICECITFIIRADRFNSGLYVRMLENKTMLRLLQALQAQVLQSAGQNDA